MSCHKFLSSQDVFYSKIKASVSHYRQYNSFTFIFMHYYGIIFSKTFCFKHKSDNINNTEIVNALLYYNKRGQIMLLDVLS